MRYRWAVLAAGTAAQTGFSTIQFGLAVLAPALRDEYDLTLTQVGVLLAAEWVGLTLSMIPWGYAADRYGERWTLAAGLTACCRLPRGRCLRAGLPHAARPPHRRRDHAEAPCSPGAAAR